MSQDPPAKTPAAPGFGRRHEASAATPPQPPANETGVGPFLAKRSTAISLVLAGSAVFLAYNVRFQQSCKIPPAGAAPESMAEYERCRSRRTSSSSRRSYSWSPGSSSSSTASHSTASRGGFGSTGSGHASGG